MLSEAINADLYPQWLAQVESKETKDAFRYMVGAASSLKELTCHVQYKGEISDFRFVDTSNQQPFSFIVNKRWLLFYFRAPSVRSGSYMLEELQQFLPTAEENARQEWKVRIHNIAEARALLNYLELE